MNSTLRLSDCYLRYTLTKDKLGYMRQRKGLGSKDLWETTYVWPMISAKESCYSCGGELLKVAEGVPCIRFFVCKKCNREIKTY